ncbi:uncharacterized protein MONBRDRAFT_22712 [Monosiga brevicollis MX1]|uniref:RRM domain-containing protein n=1 Tax=Monosiga brevicollis TaxID=81824 RepID=A9URV0_MONBE|nr:uncharacterized protein MONBRDRAFT_22712 [Monosiga brevicollis MX1]EDQ91989.1 predicted protein [Monosiga brevicollis MX1]|eukprot:XP_001743275.1 hypothetical protein [Monosiga brevicollis MX1]
MTAFLPPYLRDLFEPGPPIKHVPAAELQVENFERKYNAPLTGISAYLDQFETTAPPPRVGQFLETREARKQRKAKEAIERQEPQLSAALEAWKPKENPKATSDPFKTLFVGRLSYALDEEVLKKEFSTYGPVKDVSLVRDADGKSRGYAFIEFEHENDLKAAYKYGDGRKIEGRRVVVDVERGRTVDDWKPRRLGMLNISQKAWLQRVPGGGGLGGTRNGGPDKNDVVTGRVGSQRVEEGRRESRYEAPASSSRDRYGGSSSGGYGGDRRSSDRYGGGRGGGDRYGGGGDRYGGGGDRYGGGGDRYGGGGDRYGGGGDRYGGGGRGGDRYGDRGDRDRYGDRDRDRHGGRSSRDRGYGGGRDGRRDDRGGSNANLVPIGQRSY